MIDFSFCDYLYSIIYQQALCQRGFWQKNQFNSLIKRTIASVESTDRMTGWQFMKAERREVKGER